MTTGVLETVVLGERVFVGNDEYELAIKIRSGSAALYNLEVRACAHERQRWMHTHTHTYTHTHTHTHQNTRRHTRTNTRTHAYHARAHTHAHT